MNTITGQNRYDNQALNAFMVRPATQSQDRYQPTASEGKATVIGRIDDE
ncbi:MAG: hypothetical protein ACU84J_10125 [Gammaproteobacteria bacterium]